MSCPPLQAASWAVSCHRAQSPLPPPRRPPLGRNNEILIKKGHWCLIGARQAGRKAWLSGPKLAKPRLSVGRAEAKKESSRIQKNELTVHPHRRHRTEGTILTTFHPTEVGGPHRAGEKRPDSDGYGPLWAACTSEHLSLNGGSSPSLVGAEDTVPVVWPLPPRPWHHRHACACTFVWARWLVKGCGENPPESRSSSGMKPREATRLGRQPPSPRRAQQVPRLVTPRTLLVGSLVGLRSPPRRPPRGPAQQ